MKRVLLGILLLLPLLSFGQAPPRVTFTAYSVLDASGSDTPLASGYLCFQTTDANDRPMGYRVGMNSGQTSPLAERCVPVTNGAIAPINVINSGFSSPLNACLRVTTRDATMAEIRRTKCAQPGSAPSLSTWCTAAGGSVSCSWDAYPVGTTPVALVQVGPIGSQGPPGCVIGGTCSAALTPQSLAGRLYPTAIANTGDDLNAMVQRALYSMGGTAANPIERAVLELPVGMDFTTSTIFLPNDKTAPYVRKIDFICHDNTLTGSSPSQPILHVLPLNNNGGMNAGSLSGCVFNDPGPGVPAVQVDARQAFEVYNNKFQGGDVALRETNTLFNDGGTGYNEQHWIHHNDFENMATSGVEFLRDGGTDSFLYGSVDWTNHFQLPCGAAAIHIGAGITIQGGELSGRVNTTASTCADSNTYAVLIRNDASASGNGVYRGSVGHWSGEDTGGLGMAHFALFDGPGATILFDQGTIVSGMSLKSPTASPYSHLSLPYNLYTDSFGTDYCASLNSENIGAGGLIARKPFLANCESSLRMYSGAEGTWGDMGQFYYSGTDPQHMGSVTSAWRSFPKAFTFGPGYTPNFSDGTCPDPAGCNTPTATTEGRSLTIRIPGQTDGFTPHAEADGVHLTMEKSNTVPGQPTEWLTFDAYDTSGGAYVVKPMLKVRFENGAPNWYFPGLTGSGCAAMVIRADGSLARGASVTCP